MSRSRFRYDKATDTVYEVRGDDDERISNASAYVISDDLYGTGGMIHPATGKFMDSKSKFRAETRARGCVEVGNETQVDKVDRSLPGGLREEIGRVYDQLSRR